MESKSKSKILLLPEELLIQVLLRLPVKSLLRFKSVSKSWLSLISDPYFAISHFELAATRTHRLLFLSASVPETRSIDLDATLHDDSASAVINLNLLSPSPYNVRIMGSCRGFLLLVHEYSDLLLWNPSTCVHKQLSWSLIASNIDFFPFLYGFGYDPSRNDYLVVIASYDPSATDMVTHFEIFSFRANSWEEIEATHLPYMNASDITTTRGGSLFHGAIHWLAFRYDVNVNVIVAFNLIERSFLEIPLPNDFYYELDFCDVWVFEGHLSLCVPNWDTTDIWVMEEYKVESSWTKFIVVSTVNIPTHFFSAVCSTKNGDIIGTDGSAGLVKCNAKGELLEHRSYPHGSGAHRCAAMYTESLLSLPVDNGQRQEDD